MWRLLFLFFLLKSLLAGEPPGWHAFEQDGKWGYKDYRGKVVFAPVYDWAESVSAGSRARVMKDGKYGIIQHGALTPAPCIYDSILGFCQAGLIDGRWHILEERGNEAISLTFNTVKSGGATHTAVSRDGQWGFVSNDSRSNDKYIPPLFDDVGEFVYMYAATDQRTLAPVRQFGLWGYIRTDGTYLIHPQYEEARSFSYIGHAAVKQEEKWGIIDNKGTTLVKPLWDDVDPNSRYWDVQLFRVEKNGKWGYVNAAGILTIPCSFDVTSGFWKDRKSGLRIAVAMIDHKWGIINEDGNWRVEALYDSIHSAEFGSDGAMLWKGNMLVYVDTMGTEIKQIENPFQK